MTGSFSERRLAENEVFFRQPNEAVLKQLEELREIAVSEGYPEIEPSPDQKINFFCECADEKCRKRIALTPRQYEKLHQVSTQFIILPGHEVPEIEKVIRSSKNYFVVEKFRTPPAKATKLNKTSLDN